MSRRSTNYFPLAAAPFVLFAIILVGVVIAIELELVQYAYEKIGIDSHYVLGLLLLSLLGSRFNIPIASLPGERIVVERVVNVFGVRYVVPVAEDRNRTWIAVNVGGAIIPTLLSLYLLLARGGVVQALLVAAIVTVVVHVVARPVQGIGIAVPTLVPPLIAAGAAQLLAGDAPAVAAYVGGTIGTLVGADLLNLGKIRGLGAPVASIGGAGTFDGIFLTGILAVLLA